MNSWQDVLTAVRDGKKIIPTADNGVPLVATHAPLYELMELVEALTTGYNALVARATEDQRRIERIRKLAQAAFPGDKVAPADGWISVKDFLPKESGEYFTYGKPMGVYPYKFSALHKAWNSDDGDNGKYAVKGVTHWYPRPLPPVTAEKED